MLVMRLACTRKNWAKMRWSLVKMLLRVREKTKYELKVSRRTSTLKRGCIAEVKRIDVNDEERRKQKLLHRSVRQARNASYKAIHKVIDHQESLLCESKYCL